MSKRIFMTMLILIGSLALTGCSPTAFMNADERAEYNRVKQERAAEEQRQKVERYKRETGGKCETRSCYNEYKLTAGFETKCVDYGHRKKTAAFNQCVGMERNNYDREQQLKRMQAETNSNARAASRRAHNRQVQQNIENVRIKHKIHTCAQSWATWC